MRFKNLTITLTLTCLSVVALTGLVLLPITNGICEWTGSESSKSFYTNSFDSLGKGWHLYASLSASHTNASASVTPTVYGERAHTEAKTYSGTANVRVYRNSASAGITVFCGQDRALSVHGENSNCWGHHITSAVQEDEEKNTDIGEEQTIVAKVSGIEYWYITGTATTEKDGSSTTIDGFIDVKVKEAVNLHVGAAHTWTSEDSLTYTGTVKEKRSKWREDHSEGQSQSENISNNWAVCGAETCISFYHVSERNSVEFNPVVWGSSSS